MGKPEQNFHGCSREEGWQPEKKKNFVQPLELNKALQRQHTSLPVLEDTLHDLGQSRVFSKVELKSGYWDVHLDRGSSLLTTFQTCYGRCRWLRLHLGSPYLRNLPGLSKP